MADRHIEQVFREMDAAFDAALAAEEDSAADDLAVSLRQDLPLPALVGRGSWEVAVEEAGFCLVDQIASDYVRAVDPSDDDRRMVVPARFALLRRASVARGPAVRSEDRLLQVLRRMVRDRGSIRVGTTVAGLEGVPQAATPTHLALKGERTEWVIPIDQIRSVRAAITSTGRGD